jgi:hypothetical protein
MTPYPRRTTRRSTRRWPHPDKRLLRIEGATHYYVGQPQLLKECIDAVVGWSREKRLLLE